jgi:hypothetical protein
MLISGVHPTVAGVTISTSRMYTISPSARARHCWLGLRFGIGKLPDLLLRAISSRDKSDVAFVVAIVLRWLHQGPRV